MKSSVSARSGHLAWGAALVAGLSACSGAFTVGESGGSGGHAGAAASGGSATAGTDAVGGSPSMAGADAAGASSVGGNASGVGGAAQGGGGNTTPAHSYCRVALPATTDAAPSRSQTELFNRVKLFVTGSSAQGAAPPVNGTPRGNMGQYALQLLDSYATSSPGMTRFVKGWLPGTPIADTWAATFRTGTLLQLFTTTTVLKNGSGVLTDLGLLGTETITQRGLYISSRFLCRPIPGGPPVNSPPLQPLTPDQTRRTRLEANLAFSPICSGCHQRIDPLGYPLEHFSKLGAFSDLDNTHPIDTSGTYALESDLSLKFSGLSELGPQLGQSCEVALCLSRQVLRDARTATGQSALPQSAEDEAAARIAERFSAAGTPLRELVRAVAESDAFLQ